MSEPESIDTFLAGIEQKVYREKELVLVESVKLLLDIVGVKYDRFGNELFYDERPQRFKRRSLVERVRQSNSIALIPYDAFELNLEGSAVSIGSSERWYDSSLFRARHRPPETTDYFIWSLIHGESVEYPYEPSETGIWVSAEEHINFPPEPDRIDRFGHIILAISESLGNIELPYSVDDTNHL